MAAQCDSVPVANLGNYLIIAIGEVKDRNRDRG